MRRRPGPAGEIADPAWSSGRPRGDRLINGPTPAGAGDRAVEHIGAQHHARPAAERCVVDRAVLVGGEIADIDRVERPNPVAHALPASE